MPYSALQYAILHVTGRTRAYLLELEGLERELILVGDDPHAKFLLDLIQQTKRVDSGPGTAGYLEAEATKLLKQLSLK